MTRRWPLFDNWPLNLHPAECNGWNTIRPFEGIFVVRRARAEKASCIWSDGFTRQEVNFHFPNCRLRIYIEAAQFSKQAWRSISIDGDGFRTMTRRSIFVFRSEPDAVRVKTEAILS